MFHQVFHLSRFEGAHAHRFRQTLATAQFDKGWTTEVLRSSSGVVQTSFSATDEQWTFERQELISSLAQDVRSSRFLGNLKKAACKC